MRSHISVHHATVKYYSNSFVFKTEIEKEGLPRDSTPDLGAGVSGSNLDAPTKLFKYLAERSKPRPQNCHYSERFLGRCFVLYSLC